MTMFIDINHNSTTPGKQEVSEPSSNDNGQTQPDIVCHEHQHQQVAHRHLQHVQQRLNCVRQTHHVLPTTTALTSTPHTHTHTTTLTSTPHTTRTHAHAHTPHRSSYVFGWRFSVAVMRWSRSTQLLYIEPG